MTQVGGLLPTYVGDTGWVVGYWLQPVPAMAIVAIWRLNQQMEGILFLFILSPRSLPLFVTLSTN